MSTSPNMSPSSPPDQGLIDESQHEARSILEDALDRVAEAAYTIGAPLNLLPTTPEGDVEFDEEDLKKTGHPTLQAIAKIAEAIYAALDTLPDPPEEEGESDKE